MTTSSSFEVFLSRPSPKGDSWLLLVNFCSLFGSHRFVICNSYNIYLFITQRPFNFRILPKITNTIRYVVFTILRRLLPHYLVIRRDSTTKKEESSKRCYKCRLTIYFRDYIVIVREERKQENIPLPFKESQAIKIPQNYNYPTVWLIYKSRKIPSKKIKQLIEIQNAKLKYR